MTLPRFFVGLLSAAIVSFVIGALLAASYKVFARRTGVARAEPTPEHRISQPIPRGVRP